MGLRVPNIKARTTSVKCHSRCGSSAGKAKTAASAKGCSPWSFFLEMGVDGGRLSKYVPEAY